MLSAFPDDPSDACLVRVGCGGTPPIPLPNIHKVGFASCPMHARPADLSCGSYSGEHGPNRLSLALDSRSLPDT
ncbi:hypothetical protein F5X98DRAFT_354966 [Xylaria grammica]|nr:hypothetical protein F5X98DRAFT_354966 [Xylaria grammica]